MYTNSAISILTFDIPDENIKSIKTKDIKPNNVTPEIY